MSRFRVSTGPDLLAVCHPGRQSVPEEPTTKSRSEPFSIGFDLGMGAVQGYVRLVVVRRGGSAVVVVGLPE